MLPLLSVLAVGLLARATVGLWGYSGAATPPMFGDFEAQRHWMEVTTSLPMGDWYFNTTHNDLQYWGLDYPPLTALVSMWCGRVAQWLVPELVELHESRGHESLAGKAFMRGTVLVSDICVLFPALVLVTHLLTKSKSESSGITVLLAAVLTPALILIDHGHFQYNGISIGLTLLAMWAIIRNRDCLGSVLFTLSLNFKQMSLYHSPVFFVVLLRKCIQRGYELHHCSGRNSNSSNSGNNSASPPYRVRPFLLYLLVIGCTVIATFCILWLPFCLSPSEEVHTCSTVVLQIITRIFPFSRGIFEDKVANLWYLSSVLYDYRTLVASEVLVRSSLLLTVTLLIPVMYGLGRYEATAVRFLLGLVISALAFFLASFQVHEKSLLLALVPASLLIGHRPLDVGWFQLTGCMSLYPLLVRDGQSAPYCFMGMIYVLLCLLMIYQSDAKSSSNGSSPLPQTVTDRIFDFVRSLYFAISVPGVAVLHAAELWYPPPSHLPDLYPALFSIFGCCSLLWYYVYFVKWLLSDCMHGPDLTGTIANKKRI